MNTISPLPKQAQSIYSQLLTHGPMTAEQIAHVLHIFPNAVYRSTHKLEKLGCIEKIGKHPAQYQAIDVHQSVEAFSLLQKEWFLNAFFTQHLKISPSLKNTLNITFIESREMLFEKALSDIQNLKEEMNNFASGDELPAEIMLAQKDALHRGIIIKTLFQKRNQENESYLQARTKMGEEIRISEPLNARIVVFDRKVVYIMSHDPTNYTKSVGIRFELSLIHI